MDVSALGMQKGKRRRGEGGGVQHLGLEGAFSTSFRNAEGRTALRGGDRGALDSWGEVGAGGGPVRFGTEEAAQPGSVPVGLLCSCLRRGRRGRAGCCGPSCTAAAFPTLFIAKFGCSPLPQTFPSRGTRCRCWGKGSNGLSSSFTLCNGHRCCLELSLLQSEPFAHPQAHFPAVI